MDKTFDNCKDQVLDMINKGYTSTQISKSIGVSNACICRWRKRLGARPNKIPEELVDQIAYMYLEEEIPRAKIAETLNVKLYTVANIIMTRGLTRCSANSPMDKNIDKVKLVKVDDPIYYVDHKPTMSRCSYHGKQYRDMTAGILGG